MSKIAKIIPFDIANGTGIGVSVFYSYCTHRCPGCFNKELWDGSVGEGFNREYYETKIKPHINEHISHLSVLGGEPFDRNDLWFLLDWFKRDFPEKKIWVWSGYTYEEILSFESRERIKALLYIDVLVDGRFVEEKKDLTLRFRGSSNQHVIDVPKSLTQNKVVLYED